MLERDLSLCTRHFFLPGPDAQVCKPEMLQCPLPSDQICTVWDLEPQTCGGHQLRQFTFTGGLGLSDLSLI